MITFKETPQLVFMCSGQGSQKPGMGADLLDVSEVAEAFALASSVFGQDIAALCKAETPEAAQALNDTRNAQAAIATLSIGIGRALMARGVVPQALLGFSLGQASALALSGMLSDEDTFALIAERARIMGQVADENPGVMSAFLKGTPEEVQVICEQCAQGDVLVPANYNSPQQTVVAGTAAAVQRAEEAWSEAGKPASRLATSGAFHSPLMAPAQQPFAAYLETVTFAEPEIPVVCNTDAQLVTADTVRQRLVDHLVQPVQFTQSIAALQQAGAATFVEVGFGGTLFGLLKRCAPDATRACVQDAASLQTQCESHNE